MLYTLRPQIRNDIEVLTHSDSGRMTIGEKRNKLLEIAKGEYVIFIDDDDLIANNYVQKILEKIEKKPDCISISGVYVDMDNGITKFFKHGLKYKWGKEKEVLVRPPTHICAIKKDIAKKVRFPSMNYGEDKHYSDGVIKMCKVDEMVEEPIYFYLYTRKKEYNIETKK